MKSWIRRSDYAGGEKENTNDKNSDREIVGAIPNVDSGFGKSVRQVSKSLVLSATACVRFSRFILCQGVFNRACRGEQDTTTVHHFLQGLPRCHCQSRECGLAFVQTCLRHFSHSPPRGCASRSFHDARITRSVFPGSLRSPLPLRPPFCNTGFRSRCSEIPSARLFPMRCAWGMPPGLRMDGRRETGKGAL